MHDIVILGAGPAGLTAAIYAVRAGRKTLVIGGAKWGGQLMLTTLVENFPGFPEGIQGPVLMNNMKLQAERLGAEIITNDFTEVFFDRNPLVIMVGKEEYSAKALIVATGADAIWLNIPGEENLRGKGVSTCATCDGFFFKNKRVAVIGGGDSAMEEAHVLSQIASEVVIVHRRDTFRASKAMQERIFSGKNIRILWNRQVLSYNGKDRLESLTLKDTLTGKEEKLDLDGVFLAIGHKPNTGLFKGLELNDKGYVKRLEVIGKDGQVRYHTATSISGVFTAGDVHDYRFRQAVTAAGFGAMAALDADRFLSEGK